MDATTVPPALRERLGPNATLGLVEYVQARGQAWRGDVLETAVDRFERRLGEEIGGLRLEMTNGFAALRQEMLAGDAALRLEISGEISSLRQEMQAGDAALRQEITALRREIAENRFELLKWSFLFWIGQVAVIGGMMAFMLRGVR